MNIIGLCQGANLRIFAEILRLTKPDIEYGKVGVFVADAAYYKRSVEAQYLSTEFEVAWLKEWESLETGLEREFDMSNLSKWQTKLGPPSLWSGILTDRRLFFGKYCKSKQSYRPRYSEKQLLGALEEALDRVDKLFNTIEPDIVFGFVPVTLHEYLVLRYAEAQKVPIRLLRSTKVENYVSLNDRLFGVSDHIKKELSSPHIDKTKLVVNQYINKTRERGAIYEGMHLPDYAKRRFSISKTLRGIAGGLKNEVARTIDPEIRADSHNPGYLIPSILENIVQPLRAIRMRSMVKKSSPRLEVSNSENYCLFPLHFEPEIALQIYARPIQNQIEAARTIALSLPAGMKLLVKEHPRSAGMRPSGYYQKLLEIPNVSLADPSISSHQLVREANLVVVITGNIGLEAAVLGKPVVVLGHTDYSVLPDSMVRCCHNLYELSSIIMEILEKYCMDEKALRAYIGAVVSGSVPIDLYSVLLGKGGRYEVSGGNYDADLNLLRQYVSDRFKSDLYNWNKK